MANIKTVQERNKLHKAIWNIADELRGSVGGWEFKNYVLGTMFYRYISERITYHVNQTEWDAGNKEFDYTKLFDHEGMCIRDKMISGLGFLLLPSERFCNVRSRASSDENLNETIEQIFRGIENGAVGTPGEFGQEINITTYNLYRSQWQCTNQYILKI